MEKATDVIKGIADGCKLAGCALIGGETAEMPGMYQKGDYDLAGFAVGAVERDAILPRETKAGDILLGLKSSGLHSNGYSLARFILEKSNIKFSDKFLDSGNSVGETLLVPTKIYVKSCLAAIKTGKVKALAHITGGGLTENLPRVLSKNTKPQISYNWEMPAIFSYLQKTGNVADEEMRRTFNCGIGMVIVVDKSDAEEVKNILEKHGEEVSVIGKLI